MSTPRAPLPKRRPLRTREELLQAGRQRDGGVSPAAESDEGLAALLMLAFQDKAGGSGAPDSSGGRETHTLGTGHQSHDRQSPRRGRADR
jgi:hypothetical protein